MLSWGHEVVSMSMIKRRIEERDELRELATAVLLETGALEQCDLHEHVLIDQFDEDAQKCAYAIATNRIESGEIDADRSEFMDVIKEVITDCGDECYDCQRHRDD